MTNFSISIELREDIDPELSIEDIMGYIKSRLEVQKVLYVTNIVRDY
jgi:hypothetical protein